MGCAFNLFKKTSPLQGHKDIILYHFSKSFVILSFMFTSLIELLLSSMS